MVEIPEAPRESAAGDRAPDPQQASPLARFFFLRQTFALLLTILLVVGGVMGAALMVKEGDPDIQQAIANVNTVWVGADPETIENQITDKLETELKSLKGLDELSSASFESTSRIVVEFDVAAPVSDSLALVRAAVDEAEAELPPEAEPPTVTEVSVQDVPILTIGLFGDLDQAVMSRAAEDLQELLERVPNVREVELSGQRDEVIHVQMRPERLLQMGIAPTQVAGAIRESNQDTPWDRVESDEIGAQLRFYGRFRSLDSLAALPVARIGSSTPEAHDGRVVRLDEVADVRRDLEREEVRAAVNNDQGEFQPAIIVDLIKVPGSDSIRAIREAIATLEAAQADPSLWPYGMQYRVINTDADVIQEDLQNVASNVLQGIVLVSLVLLLALTWREAAIAALSIPLAFSGALAILWLGGSTLNTMVQIGMILALGLLVDVFILMMEGMHDGIFVEGLSWPQAALQTVQTYAAPAFSGQLTTILALAPLMAIGGTMGKFIRLIPISAIICLVASYAIALLIDIPLSYYLLGGIKRGTRKTFVDRLTESAQEAFAGWTLATTIRNKTTARLWICAALAAFVASVVLIGTVPGTLFPDSDQRKLSVNIELAPTATLDAAQTVADEIGAILLQQDYLESVVKLVGQRSNLVQESGIKPQTADYLVGFSAVFVPREERDRDSYQYTQDLRAELQAAIRQHPGASLVVNRQTTGEPGDPIQLQISGPDMDVLRQLSNQAQVLLRGIPGSLDVRDDLGPLLPDLKFIPRREALDFYGLSADEVAQQGRFYMTDNDIGDFPLGGGEEDLEIRLSTRWPSRLGAVGGPTTLPEIAVTRIFTASGETLTGEQVLQPLPGQAPISITHQDGQRTVTVLAKTQDRTVGEIWADLEPPLQAMQQAEWPRGYSYRLAGEAETQNETFGSAFQMAGVAIFLVFAVLVLQFGSFSQPLIVMVAIPLALIGTFVGFFIFQIPVSFPAVIGIIALTGIVVNDAIVMVETMNNSRQEGLDVRQAAAAGAARRLRPILTTSITTIAGVIPLALSDPVWFPLASAIGFGLVASTAIALLIVPCFYLLLTPQRSTAADTV